jgi:lipoate-protein ligase A
MELHLVHLGHMPILKQLQLEEALLRTDNRSFCLMNQGSSPAIVMGISGKEDELIDCKRRAELSLPLIRRFSGGGTVVIDENTLFVTFIMNEEFSGVKPTIDAIHHFIAEIYSHVFHDLDFKLCENDYVIGERKFGGNAQYLRKGRWLHHTSFLWDYSPERMKALKMPKKIPNYRQGRSHPEFLCCLKEFLTEQKIALTRLEHHLSHIFEIRTISQDSLENILQRPHRQATVQLV